jgi:hypothetical protein
LAKFNYFKTFENGESHHPLVNAFPKKAFCTWKHFISVTKTGQIDFLCSLDLNSEYERVLLVVWYLFALELLCLILLLVYRLLVFIPCCRKQLLKSDLNRVGRKILDFYSHVSYWFLASQLTSVLEECDFEILTKYLLYDQINVQEEKNSYAFKKLSAKINYEKREVVCLYDDKLSESEIV